MPLVFSTAINVTAYYETLVINEACNGTSAQVYWTVNVSRCPARPAALRRLRTPAADQVELS